MRWILDLYCTDETGLKWQSGKQVIPGLNSVGQPKFVIVEIQLQPEKVVNGKQEKALREELRLFMSKCMGTAAPPDAMILKAVKYEGIESLAVRCKENLVTPRKCQTLLTVFYYILD